MFFQMLVFAASLELGGMFGGVYNYTKVPVEQSTVVPLYTTMKGEVSYEGLFVGGQMDCYFLANTITNFVPFQNTYVFKVGYRSGPMEIGFNHSCYHPMSSYSTLSLYENEIKPKYEGFVEKVYIKFELP